MFFFETESLFNERSEVRSPHWSHDDMSHLLFSYIIYTCLMHVCLTIFTLKGNFININHFSNIIARIQLTFHSIVCVFERERE